MKPRDLLLVRIEDSFVPFMERRSFRYSKSRIKFSRKVDVFTQTVEFSLSKWNSEDNCRFWTMWGVHSILYVKWYKSEWGVTPSNNSLVGCADWNIPGWTRDVAKNFSLVNSEKDFAEIESLIENVRQAGFPYLERISSWRSAAEELLASQRDYCKAADILLVAGEKKRAEEVLLEGIEKVEAKGSKAWLGELSELKKRLQRYF